MMKKSVAPKKPMVGGAVKKPVKKYAMGGGVTPEAAMMAQMKADKAAVSGKKAPTPYAGEGAKTGAASPDQQLAMQAATSRQNASMMGPAPAPAPPPPQRRLSPANQAALDRHMRQQELAAAARALDAQRAGKKAPPGGFAKGGAVKGKKPAVAAIMIAMPMKKGKTKMAMGGCATKKK